jgi:integrase/recombinase XerD
MQTLTDAQLIHAYAAHQRVRGFSQRTIDRRTWSLEHLAAQGMLATHDAHAIELFLSRWPSAQSRYSVRSDVKQFYRWAIRRGELEQNPTDDVDPPKLPKRSATPLSTVDLMEAIRLGNPAQRRAVMLGAYAGLRCGEIAALQMADVHRERGVIVVRNGKGGKDGIVPLSPVLALVLPQRGKAVSYQTGQAVGSEIRRLFRKAGIDARPHDLRHSFGTEAARRANGNMELVRRLMRHESITTTQRYVEWNPDGGYVIDHLYAA